MKRRRMVSFAALAVFSLALAGLMIPSQAQAAKAEVVVACFGGDFHRILNEAVRSSLSEIAPGVEPVFAVGLHTAAMTKMRAEKDGKGTLDVIHLNERDMWQMVNEGLILKLDPAKLPNLKKVLPQFRESHFVTHMFSPNVLIYNKEKVKPAPTSWKELWNPKYKGQIGISTTHWTENLFAAAAVKGISDGTNWDDAWDLVKQLKNQKPKAYASNELMGTAMQTGEVWMGINRRARAVQWWQQGGKDLVSVVPDEGSFTSLFCAGIPKNAKNIDAAHAYIDALLTIRAQSAFAERMFYNGTLEQVPISPELRGILELKPEDLKRVKAINLEYVGRNFAIWKQKWDREVIVD